MNTAAVSGTGRARRERTFWIFAASLLIAVLLHLLPALVFTPVKNVRGKEQTDRRFTVMVNNVPTAQYDPCDLYYWLKYGDPALFAAPDYDSGFSAYLKNRQSHIEADDSIQPMQLSLTRKSAFPENVYSNEPRSMNALLSPLNIRMPFSLAADQDKMTERNEIFPKWTAANGADLGNLFSDKEEIQRQLKKFTPERSTVLFLSRGRTPDMPPLIKVSQSSGNTSLDMLAVGALASYAGAEERGAALKNLKYVIVDWGTIRRKQKK